MTAKEFDKKFWNENNPMTTPLWKAMKAYADYYHTEQLRLSEVGVTLPTSNKLTLMARKITFAIQNALPPDQSLDELDFFDLEEEWFDWLNDEINGN